MLKDKNSSAIVAVKDLDRAKTFYSDLLGLNLADTSNEGMLGYRTGNTWLTVYKSDFAGTNQANAVTWDVGVELDDIVEGLKAGEKVVVGEGGANGAGAGAGAARMPRMF